MPTRRRSSLDYPEVEQLHKLDEHKKSIDSVVESEVIGIEHPSRYSPIHQQSDDEDEPSSSPSFGDKLKGFAKKAGMVAGGAILAPAALAAMGASAAYDSIVSRKRTDDSGETVEEEKFVAEHLPQPPIDDQQLSYLIGRDDQRVAIDDYHVSDTNRLQMAVSTDIGHKAPELVLHRPSIDESAQEYGYEEKQSTPTEVHSASEPRYTDDEHRSPTESETEDDEHVPASDRRRIDQTTIDTTTTTTEIFHPKMRADQGDGDFDSELVDEYRMHIDKDHADDQVEMESASHVIADVRDQEQLLEHPTDHYHREDEEHIDTGAESPSHPAVISSTEYDEQIAAYLREQHPDRYPEISVSQHYHEQDEEEEEKHPAVISPLDDEPDDEILEVIEEDDDDQDERQQMLEHLGDAVAPEQFEEIRRRGSADIHVKTIATVQEVDIIMPHDDDDRSVSDQTSDIQDEYGIIGDHDASFGDKLKGFAEKAAGVVLAPAALAAMGASAAYDAIVSSRRAGDDDGDMSPSPLRSDDDDEPLGAKVHEREDDEQLKREMHEHEDYQLDQRKLSDEETHLKRMESPSDGDQLDKDTTHGHVSSGSSEQSMIVHSVAEEEEEGMDQLREEDEDEHRRLSTTDDEQYRKSTDDIAEPEIIGTDVYQYGRELEHVREEEVASDDEQHLTEPNEEDEHYEPIRSPPQSPPIAKSLQEVDEVEIIGVTRPIVLSSSSSEKISSDDGEVERQLETPPPTTSTVDEHYSDEKYISHDQAPVYVGVQNIVELVGEEISTEMRADERAADILPPLAEPGTESIAYDRSWSTESIRDDDETTATVDDDEPESRSFAEKLKKGAKSVGMGAAMVAVAPAALVAMGASAAYSKLRKATTTSTSYEKVQSDDEEEDDEHPKGYRPLTLDGSSDEEEKQQPQVVAPDEISSESNATQGSMAVSIADVHLPTDSHIVEHEVDYEADLREKLAQLAEETARIPPLRSSGGAPFSEEIGISEEDETDVIAAQQSENRRSTTMSSRDSSLDDNQVPAFVANVLDKARPTDDDEFVDEEEDDDQTIAAAPGSIATTTYYSATEGGARPDDYDTCVTSQEDTFESAANTIYSQESSQYTTASMTPDSRLSSRSSVADASEGEDTIVPDDDDAVGQIIRRDVVGQQTPTIGTPTKDTPILLFESPVQSDRMFTVQQDFDIEPTSTTDSLEMVQEVSESSKAPTPDKGRSPSEEGLPEIEIEEQPIVDEERELEFFTIQSEAAIATTMSGILLAPESDPGRPISPVPPRYANNDDYDPQDYGIVIPEIRPHTFGIEHQESDDFLLPKMVIEVSPETDTTRSIEPLAETELTPSSADDEVAGQHIMDDLPDDGDDGGGPMIASDVTLAAGEHEEEVDDHRDWLPEDEPRTGMGLGTKVALGALGAVGAVVAGPAILATYGTTAVGSAIAGSSIASTLGGMAAAAAAATFYRPGEQEEEAGVVDIHDRAMDIDEQESATFAGRHYSDISISSESQTTSSQADTIIHHQLSSSSRESLTDDPLTMGFQRRPPDQEAPTKSDSTDSLKSGGSAGGKRFSTSRRSSTSSSSRKSAVADDQRLTPDDDDLKTSWPSMVRRDSSDDIPSGDIMEKSVSNPQLIKDEEVTGVVTEYDTAYPDDVEEMLLPPATALELELETVQEEPEDDGESLGGSGGSGGSSGLPTGTALNETLAMIAQYKQSAMSSDNVSESSLQEFERIERELLTTRGVGDTGLSTSDMDIFAQVSAHRRTSGGNGGSTSSLVEFERLEQEIAEGRVPLSPSSTEQMTIANGGSGGANGDVMILSDIREESETEDMSTRDDDEEEEVDLQSSTYMPVELQSIPISSDELEEERIPTPTGTAAQRGSTAVDDEEVPVSDADSIDGFEHITVPVTGDNLQTSTDSLDPPVVRLGHLPTTGTISDRDSLEGVGDDRDSLQDYEIVDQRSTVDVVDSHEYTHHDSLEDVAGAVGGGAPVVLSSSDDDDIGDKDSVLEGASQDMLMMTTSQEEEEHDGGQLSCDTVGTYQEYEDDRSPHAGNEPDRDSLTEDIDHAMSTHRSTPRVESLPGSTTMAPSVGSESTHVSFPCTLTTFETSQIGADGALEVITRSVTTRVVDPVLSHVHFTGTETEERVREYLAAEDAEHFETVDDQGNVTVTTVRRRVTGGAPVTALLSVTSSDQPVTIVKHEDSGYSLPSRSLHYDDDNSPGGDASWTSGDSLPHHPT